MTECCCLDQPRHPVFEKGQYRGVCDKFSYVCFVFIVVVVKVWSYFLSLRTRPSRLPSPWSHFMSTAGLDRYKDIMIMRKCLKVTLIDHVEEMEIQIFNNSEYPRVEPSLSHTNIFPVQYMHAYIKNQAKSNGKTNNEKDKFVR